MKRFLAFVAVVCLAGCGKMADDQMLVPGSRFATIRHVQWLEPKSFPDKYAIRIGLRDDGVVVWENTELPSRGTKERP